MFIKLHTCTFIHLWLGDLWEGNALLNNIENLHFTEKYLDGCLLFTRNLINLAGGVCYLYIGCVKSPNISYFLIQTLLLVLHYCNIELFRLKVFQKGLNTPRLAPITQKRQCRRPGKPFKTLRRAMLSSPSPTHQWSVLELHRRSCTWLMHTWER